MSSLDLLGDDTLLEIFDYLDEKDLKNCEKVCTGWKCLIKSFFTPTRLYEKKMRSSETWQKYLKVRARNQVIPQMKYPKLKIAGEVMCLEKNWQTWNYQLKLYLFEKELKGILHKYTTFVMDDDYLFWIWPVANEYQMNCTIIDKKTMTVKCSDGNAFFKAPRDPIYTAKIHNHMIVARFLNTFSFLDVNTGQQVKDISGEHGVCCFGNCGLFLLHLNCELKIWRMNTALDMKFVRKLHFLANIPNRLIEWEILEMDDEYIAVSVHGEHERAEVGLRTTVYLVSTKTLEIERSLSTARIFDFDTPYERGFLILVSNYSIRLVHAASGRCFSVVDVTGRRGVTSNSRYLVIWQGFYQKTVNDEKIHGTKLKLFDLQLLRSASCPDTPPFTEHWVPFVTRDCRADEIQLVFTCKSNDGESVQLRVFDFSPVEEAIATSN